LPILGSVQQLNCAGGRFVANRGGGAAVERPIVAEYGVTNPSVDFSRYVVDRRPISSLAADEIGARFEIDDADAIVLTGADGKAFAVIVRPREFNFLLGLLELARSIPEYLKRSLDRDRTLVTPHLFRKRTGG
jgi:hypothetical protein